MSLVGNGNMSNHWTTKDADKFLTMRKISLEGMTPKQRISKAAGIDQNERAECQERSGLPIR